MKRKPGADAFAIAVDLLTQSGMAKVVSQTQAAISFRVSRGDNAKAEWCALIEEATAKAGQRITAAELRPDIFGKRSTAAAE